MAASAARTKGTGVKPGEFLVLGSIQDMRFLVPVVPGDTMQIEVQVLKFVGDFALVEGIAKVNDVVVAQGKMGFARREM